MLSPRSLLNKILFLSVLIFSGCAASDTGLATHSQLQYISKEELQQQIHSFERCSNPVRFTRTENGFKVNGNDFTDRDGLIEDVYFNQATDSVNYLVHVKQNDFLIKTFQACSDKKPLVVAKVKKINNSWNINTVTNERFVGQTLILGSKGFLFVQNNGEIGYYDYENGVKNIHLPANYQLSKFQSGDFSQTNVIMLKSSPKDTDHTSNLINNVLHTISKCIGHEKKYEYHLMDINTAKLVKLNISDDGAPSQICTKYTGRWINQKCVQYKDRIETLSTGANWMRTKEGVIVISVENDSKQIYMTNFATEKKVLLDTCSSKFKGFKTELDMNGKLHVISTCNDSDKTILVITI